MGPLRWATSPGFDVACISPSAAGHRGRAHERRGSLSRDEAPGSEDASGYSSTTRAWAKAASRFPTRRSRSCSRKKPPRPGSRRARTTMRRFETLGLRADQSWSAPARRGRRASSGDIDIVYVYGYGFPPHRGGPMWYADEVGVKHVRDASSSSAGRRSAAREDRRRRRHVRGAFRRQGRPARRTGQCVKPSSSRRSYADRRAFAALSTRRRAPRWRGTSSRSDRARQTRSLESKTSSSARLARRRDREQHRRTARCARAVR